MGRRDHPYAKVGRPVERVTTKWSIIHSGRSGKFNYGLIQRTRTGAVFAKPQVSYAVVRSDKPILQNGTKLRPLEAVDFKSNGFRKHYPCKAQHPEAWHSSLPKARTKFGMFVKLNPLAAAPEVK